MLHPTVLRVGASAAPGLGGVNNLELWVAAVGESYAVEPLA